MESEQIFVLESGQIFVLESGQILVFGEGGFSANENKLNFTTVEL